MKEEGLLFDPQEGRFLHVRSNDMKEIIMQACEHSHPVMSWSSAE